MANKVNQIYEEYWSYTAAYTDVNGVKFISVLRECVAFLDSQWDSSYSNDKYEELQRTISNVTGITLPSVRKAINQLVKLGFLKPYLAGYYPEAKEFLEAKTDKKRQSVLSKTVYKHSNFNNSMTSPDVQGYGQINFFIKTLEEVGVITEEGLIALMSVDINNYSDGYLTEEELMKVYFNASESGFIERKYNQIAHLKNLLGRLDDLQIHDKDIYFKTDAERLFGDDDETRKIVRDPYLQRVYKSELEEESNIHFECDIPKCMIEGLSFPVLIASHIKPYKSSSPNEAFDVNNGLLLSKNFDSLFDLGYITFNNDGTIYPSKVLNQDVKNFLLNYRLHQDFINPKRLKYMEYHREKVFEKRFSLKKNHISSEEKTTKINNTFEFHFSEDSSYPMAAEELEER